MGRHSKPCDHKGSVMFRHTAGGSWNELDYGVCNDCGLSVPNPIPLKYRCTHNFIDNLTWRCKRCHELMLSQSYDAETILSAPNAAACRSPDHLRAIANGEEFECHHSYTPDVSRQREVVIGYTVSYQCERCVGTLAYNGWMHIECGRVHRGDNLALDDPFPPDPPHIQEFNAALLDSSRLKARVENTGH